MGTQTENITSFRSEKTLFKSFRLMREGNKLVARMLIEGASPANCEVHLRDNRLKVSVLEKDENGLRGVLTESVFLPGVDKAVLLGHYVKDSWLHVEMLTEPLALNIGQYAGAGDTFGGTRA